ADLTIIVRNKGNGENTSVVFRNTSSNIRVVKELVYGLPVSHHILHELIYGLKESKFSENDREGFRNLIYSAPTPLEIPFVGAPIRAKPERTYELTSDQPRPQGNHVPVVLSQIYETGEWEYLREPLFNFSSASGLFDQLVVKRLGAKE